MNRPTFYIEKTNGQFEIQMHDLDQTLLLRSKSFDTFNECEKFIDTLRVHMCFQTNFSRSKNQGGQFGFEIRTCWDDLIAVSPWYNDRQERENAMQTTFSSNKGAIFIHTSMFKKAPDIALTEVA